VSKPTNKRLNGRHHYLRKVHVKTLFLIRHYLRKVHVKTLFLIRHYLRKVHVKTLFLILHTKNRLISKVLDTVKKILADTRLSDEPPNPGETQYGAREISKGICITENHQIKVGYAVLAYERQDYLRDCLESILVSKLSNDRFKLDLFVIDDGSSHDLNWSEIQTTLDKFNHVDLKLIKCESANGTAGAVINRALGIMQRHGDYHILGWGDPDCIYNANWLEKTIDSMLWLERQAGSRVGLVTSYASSTNSGNHRILETIETPFGNWDRRKQAGMANAFLFSSRLRSIGLFHETLDDETVFISRLNSLQLHVYSPKLSLIEHIGQKSSLNPYRHSKVTRADMASEIVKEGWPNFASKYKTFSFVEYFSPINNVYRSSPDITDVVFVAHPKDFRILKQSIRSVREYLEHPIGEIFLISPYEASSRDLAKSEAVTLVDEKFLVNKVLDYGELFNRREDRSKWLYQQMLKLSSASLGLSEYTFILDADTVLTKPQAYSDGENFLVQFSKEFHYPYFETYSRLFKEDPPNYLSNVCHQIFFPKVELSNMLEEIQKIHSMEWLDAIYINSDLSDSSGFSEYETLGHWLSARCSGNIVHTMWKNSAFPAKEIENLHEIKKVYGRGDCDFQSFSFHSYL
jgi:hypothetical protein